MRFTSDKLALEYLNTHHRIKFEALDKIVGSLSIPHTQTQSKSVDGCKFLRTVEFCDLTTWDSFISKSSVGLINLAKKIDHMVCTGKEDSVLLMLEKIASGRVKSLSKPRKGGNSEYLGKGHFRWNDSAIVLSNEDIKIVRSLFSN